MPETTWKPVSPLPRNLSDRIQRTVLLTATRLPRVLSHALAPSPVPVQRVDLDRGAQGLAALSSRTGLRMVIDESASSSRTTLTASAGALRGAPLPVDAQGTTILGPDGAFDARLYTPRAPSSALLVFAHGGGWAIGDLDVYDYACRFLAHRSGVQVLSVDYRLAPEHPHPAGLDDLLAAYRWAVAHADDLGVAADRIAIGGESAGANLSAVASTMLAEAGTPPSFQWLLYPATDLAAMTVSRTELGAGLMLTEPDIRWFYDSYVGSIDPGDPLVSPLRGDVPDGLPATYIATAGYDPLRDEGESYARKLAAAGVDVRHDDRADLVHGYLVFASLGGAFQRAATDAAHALRAWARG
jgi:acetyl esterase